jgi:hypothetical protein
MALIPVDRMDSLSTSFARGPVDSDIKNKMSESAISRAKEVPTEEENWHGH